MGLLLGKEDRFGVHWLMGFRRDVDEICGLLGNYTASCSNYLPTFRDNVGILTREDGTDTLSRNVDWILTQATDLPSQTTDQDVSGRGHGGYHEGHKLVELEKKNELEVELLKLKQSVNEDEADPISVSSSSLRDTSRGGQPEYTNEDLEEELTGIRPLEIPLHFSEVGRVSDLERQHYATSTMRTFGELDFEGLTTISGRMSELQRRKESKDSINDSSDWNQYTNAYRLRTEEVERNLDGSNISPPVTTTTEKYTKNTADTDKDEDNEIENEEDDDYDDDNDDNHDDDDDGDDDDCGDEDDNDESGDDENDYSVDNEDSNDESNEDNEDKYYSNTQNFSITSEDNKKTHVGEGKSKSKTVESTHIMSKKSKTFQDSVEHGRQWKDDSEEISTAGWRSGEEVSSSTTTSTSARSRSVLQLELAAFLKNDSPEAEDPENWNVTEEVGKKDGARNTKEHRQSEEAELDTFRKLQQIREHVKRANIPQKLVDSVSPKADEDLLELMVRIAENPSEWQQIHHILQRLDDDLVTSRKSLLEAKSVGKSKSREEKKTADEGDAVHVFSNKNKEKMRQRKYQQAEKKKKKKKQKQKEKLKATEEKEATTLKVKNKEEIRREELEKAGVLPPANAMFKDNDKGKMSKVSKEISNSKIKDNSLPSLNSANIRDRNKNNVMNFDKETKERGKEWSIMQAQKANNHHVSSIDSAIAYLSEPEEPLTHLNNKEMPIPTKPSDVREKYNWSETLKDIATDMNRTYTWSNPSADWRHDSNKLYGSFSNSKSDQKFVNSRIKSADWIKTPSRLENMYGETDSKNLVGIPSFSGPLGKSTPKNRMPYFRGFLDKDVSESRRPAFGNSLDKDIPENKVHSWKQLKTGINNRWTGMNPKEERRYYGGDPVYNSPNRGWPRFSVESLKHGNLAGNVKTWPDLPIDQSMDSNREGYSIDETSDNWPNFPLGTHISMQNPYAYNWPKYSDDSTSQNSITNDKISAWSKPSLDPSVPKQTEVNTNTWSHIKHPHQKPVSPIDTTLAHHTKEASSNKQWPHFAYHRVTSSPQILAQQQKEAQQRARHRNAYIAVSVIAPPGKSKGLNKTQNKTNGSLLQTPEKAWNKVNEPPTKAPATTLPDKMDQLLAMRSEKQKFPGGEDLLEEQLVDMAVAGQQQRSAIPWSHARHLDKIQEQLKTLSDMGEKLRYHWLEKERLLQILRDGGKSGSGFFRSQRDESTGRETATTTTSTTSIDPPSPLPSSHTTQPSSAP